MPARFSYYPANDQTDSRRAAPVRPTMIRAPAVLATAPNPFLRVFAALPRSPRRCGATWTSLNCHGATDPSPRYPRPRVTATVLYSSSLLAGNLSHDERRLVPRSMGQYTRTGRRSSRERYAYVRHRAKCYRAVIVVMKFVKRMENCRHEWSNQFFFESNQFLS